MDKKFKILLACPTSKHKHYCFYEWAEHVKKVTYKPDIYIVDNSENSDYHKKIADKFRVDYVNPVGFKSNQELITYCQNKIRDVVLNEGYDFLFSLESDQFPPFNIIEHLLLYKKAVSCIPYFTGIAFESYLLEFCDEGFGHIKTKRAKTLFQSFMDCSGFLRPAFQTGIGCTLIHRKVLEKIQFRVEENDPESPHSDTFFHEDLLKLGIPLFMDTSIISEHKNSNWYKILQKK